MILTEFQSILLYLSIYLLSSMFLFFGVNKLHYRRNSSILLIVVSFLIPFLFASLRYNVGSDYYSYLRIFNEVNNDGFFRSLTLRRHEPLYIGLNYLVSLFTNDGQYVFVVSSFIRLFLVYYTIIYFRNKLHVGLALFLYLMLFYLSHWTTLRMGIAYGFVFVSLIPLYNRKFVKHYSLVIIGVLFHYSAIVFLPVYYIMNKLKIKSSYKGILAVFLIPTILLSFLALNVLTPEWIPFANYFQREKFGFNVHGGFNQNIINSFPLILSMIYYKVLLNRDTRNVVVLDIFFIGSILHLLTFYMGIFDRMTGYFLMTQVLVLSQIPYVTKGKWGKILIFFSIMIYYVIINVYQFIGDSSYIPYKFIISLY